MAKSVFYGRKSFGKLCVNFETTEMLAASFVKGTSNFVFAIINDTASKGNCKIYKWPADGDKEGGCLTVVSGVFFCVFFFFLLT